MNSIDEAFFKEKGFVFLDYIGRGGYGFIFLVSSLQYKENFAVKRVLEKSFNKSEIECMRQVDHPNIVNLYQYYYYYGFVYMVMEYCPDNMQRDLLHKAPYKTDELLKLTSEMAHAIKACHDNNISHNDIKPSNFLFDKYRRVKLCDFGLSKIHKAGDVLSSSYVGSIAFIAPEIFLQVPYDSFKADIWSFGVTLYVMATGKIPWKQDSVETVKNSIQGGPIDFDIIENKQFREVVESCMQRDASKRPTIKEIVENPIFDIHAKPKPKLVFLKPGKYNATTLSTLSLKKGIIKPILRSQIKMQLNVTHANVNEALFGSSLNAHPKRFLNQCVPEGADPKA